jgi:hypothetical protein
MPRTKTGNLTGVVQPRTCGWKRSTGYWEKIAADYTDEASAITAGRSLIIRGYEYTVTPLSGGCYRMEATGEWGSQGSDGTDSSPNEALNDVWELQPNMVEKDFFDADISLVNSLSNADMKKVKDAIEKLTGDQSASFTGNSLKCYKLLSAGVKSIRTFAPVLRHNQTFRRDYTVRASLTNVGSVITNASLSSIEGVPETLLFNLPTNSNPSRTDGVGLGYGWLKKYPTISQVAGGKWSIQQEWEWGLWSVDLYAFV